jgi:CDP-glucose 4,6-dehydratase
MDIRDRDGLSAAFRKWQPEVVFHLAAQALVRESYVTPFETFDVNMMGTAAVLEAARSVGSTRAVIVVTSDKCYENTGKGALAFREEDPLGGSDPYSASKAGAEIVAQAYRRSFLQGLGIGLATVRAGNVIGGGDWARDRIVPDIVRAHAQGEAVSVRNPGYTRPWQFVLEPLYGYLMLGTRLGNPDLRGHGFDSAWNFGPSARSSRPVRDLVEAFLAEYGSGSWKDCSGGSESMPEAAALRLAWDKAYTLLGWWPALDFQASVVWTSRWYKAHASGEDAGRLCHKTIKAYMDLRNSD